jgi:hypothetical protein
MLAADKLMLQSNVKQRSIQLREKELKLFNTNFSAVATQSAVMAGFTLTSFVEIDLPPNKMVAKAMLHFFITMSICSNFLCVAMVTFVTVWGSGKALRGLDGSMDVAVDGMNAERSFIFTAFAVGVLATLGCLFAAGWVLMETEIALIASVLVLTTMYMVIAEARRIHNRFYLAPDEHVTFEELRDIFPATRGEGAATPGAELSAATAAGKVAATASCRTPSPAAMRQSKSFSTPTGKERGE